MVTPMFGRQSLRSLLAFSACALCLLILAPAARAHMLDDPEVYSYLEEVWGKVTDDDGYPLPRGTEVKVVFSKPGTGGGDPVSHEVSASISDSNGSLHITIPEGYLGKGSSFVIGGQVEYTNLLKYDRLTGWYVYDPIVPNGYDTWSLSSDSGRVYSRETFDARLGYAVMERYDVLGTEIHVQYGDGAGDIFDVSVISGRVDLSGGHTITLSPGPIGQINLNTNIFDLRLNGVFSSPVTMPWSMSWSGDIVLTGDPICPRELRGDATGYALQAGVPEPSSLLALATGLGALAGTILRRRR